MLLTAQGSRSALGRDPAVDIWLDFLGFVLAAPVVPCQYLPKFQ